jgi:hypothetical protein
LDILVSKVAPESSSMWARGGIIISKQWHEFQLALGVGFIRGVGARSISSFIGQFGPTHSLPCLAATEIRVLQLEDSPEKSVEDAKKGYSIRTTKYTG